VAALGSQVKLGGGFMRGKGSTMREYDRVHVLRRQTEPKGSRSSDEQSRHERTNLARLPKTYGRRVNPIAGRDCGGRHEFMVGESLAISSKRPSSKQSWHAKQAKEGVKRGNISEVGREGKLQKDTKRRIAAPNRMAGAKSTAWCAGGGGRAGEGGKKTWKTDLAKKPFKGSLAQFNLRKRKTLDGEKASPASSLTKD